MGGIRNESVRGTPQVREARLTWSGQRRRRGRPRSSLGVIQRRIGWLWRQVVTSEVTEGRSAECGCAEVVTE